MMGLGLEMQDGGLQFSNCFLYKFTLAPNTLCLLIYTHTIILYYIILYWYIYRPSWVDGILILC